MADLVYLVELVTRDGQRLVVSAHKTLLNAEWYVADRTEYCFHKRVAGMSNPATILDISRFEVTAKELLE